MCLFSLSRDYNLLISRACTVKGLHLFGRVMTTFFLALKQQSVNWLSGRANAEFI